MTVTDLLRLTKEILRREGDIDVISESSFVKMEPDLKVREVKGKKVLVISGVVVR